MVEDEQSAEPRHQLSTVEYVVERIREGLKQGTYVGGQRLIEADLTEQYGASRTSVREAIRRLSAEGLISIEHNRGAIVPILTEADLVNIYEVREALESMSARLAAKNAVAESKSRLNVAFNALLAAQTAGDVKQYSDANECFHDLIIKLSNNPHLVRLTSQLNIPIYRYRFQSMLNPSAVSESMKEHEAIFKAILANDAESAEAAMKLHIQRSRQFVVGLLPRRRAERQ